MKSFQLLSLLCMTCTVAGSQETKPRYTIGIELTGSKPSCPVFVNSVRKKSPAEQAGIEQGDRLIAVDTIKVKDVQDAAQRIRSAAAEPVKLQLVRNEKLYTVTVRRVEFATLLQENGLKMLNDGAIVSADDTDAEVAYSVTIRQAFGNAKDLSVAFPGHYPPNKLLFYPGFEVLSGTTEIK
jgi:membrane-associated protease RseP (regulator of RpoE activity)